MEPRVCFEGNVFFLATDNAWQTVFAQALRAPVNRRMTATSKDGWCRVDDTGDPTRRRLAKVPALHC